MEKSPTAPPARSRRILPWILFAFGLVIGTVTGRTLLNALEGVVFKTNWHRVIFIKQDVPHAGIRTMRLDGHILEHRFVTQNFVLTNAITTREGAARLTFIYQLSAESPAINTSVDLTIPSERHCLSEIVLTVDGPINRGCVEQIKALF